MQPFEGIVSNLTTATKVERYWIKQRELQHVVLLYLTANGPTQWDDLSHHFDQGETGEIGPALRYLAQWMHITVEDNIVRISALGTARLNNGRP
jgi:hypothetical protein